MSALTTPAAPNWTGWETGKPFDYLNSKTGVRMHAGRVERLRNDGCYIMSRATPDGSFAFIPNGSHIGESDWRVVDPLPAMTDRALAFIRDQAKAGNDEARAVSEEIEPVEPLLKEAREIAAALCEQHDLPKNAVRVRAGQHDDWIAVQCALAGLRRRDEIERERSK